VLSGECLRAEYDVALALVLYRFCISPSTRKCAIYLGAGLYPLIALNGAYPTDRPRRGAVLKAAAIIAPITAAEISFGNNSYGPLHFVPNIALAALIWRYVTSDYDAAQAIPGQRLDRIMVLTTGTAAIFYAPIMLAALVMICGRLGGWTHHSSASVRVVKVSLAWSLSSGLICLVTGTRPSPADAVALIWLVGVAFLSHYVKAFLAKVQLGDRPWAWPMENRLDMLVASAYSWGWARFIPSDQMKGILRAVGSVGLWLNWATILVEALGLIGYWNRWLLVAALASAALFNVTVALAAGLFFLENIVVGAALAIAVAYAPSYLGNVAFGFVAWLTTLIIMALAMIGWTWHPTGLGWWDTPLTQQVYLNATTASGKPVQIYNDFMSPYDREYGRNVGHVFLDERVVTYPLGGVENSELKRRLLVLDVYGDDLCAIKQSFGVVPYDAERSKRQLTYLTTLFRRLADGSPKSPLPSRLVWLKAPSGHLYRWGELPRYRLSQGAIKDLEVRYRETYYCSAAQDWVVVGDRLLARVDIWGSAADLRAGSAPGTRNEV
jgi:hypothetical protein